MCTELLCLFFKLRIEYVNRMQGSTLPPSTIMILRQIASIHSFAIYSHLKFNFSSAFQVLPINILHEVIIPA
jgi:hypothetical protein